MKVLSHTVNSIEKYITNYSGNVLSESSDIADGRRFDDNTEAQARDWLTDHGYNATNWHSTNIPHPH